MRSEQRKHDRLTPKENAFAALGHKYTIVGKIKNISMGGLSFEYIAGEEINKDASELDIFLVGTEFHLRRAPCKIIYNIDAHVPQINNHLVKMYTTKRCGVQFRRLTKESKELLNLFLKYHVKGSGS